MAGSGFLGCGTRDLYPRNPASSFHYQLQEQIQKCDVTENQLEKLSREKVLYIYIQPFFERIKLNRNAVVQYCFANSGKLNRRTGKSESRTNDFKAGYCPGINDKLQIAVKNNVVHFTLSNVRQFRVRRH